MNLMKLLAALTLTSLLAGCSIFGKPTTIKEPEIVKPDIPIVARPAPLDLKYMKFKIITKDNVDEFLRDLQTEEVYVIMSIKDYEILSTNIADIKAYILEQQRIIIYYEEAIGS